MMQVERFSYKLAGMRKPDSFIVYPRKENGPYIAQGSRTIAAIDPISGKGLLNWKGSGSKYFAHLNTRTGAEYITFPREFVNLVINFHPSSGDLIGSSPETGPVYVV